MPGLIALLAACEGADRHPQDLSTVHQPATSAQSSLGRGESTTLEIRAVSTTAAMEGIERVASVQMTKQRGRCFNILRARQGILANAAAGGEVHAVVNFLEANGILFTETGDLPSEPIEIELMREPSRYKQGPQEGVYVLFRQRVGGFVKQDSLIGGQFIGQDLYMVAGCLHDPAKSPTKTAAPSIADSDAARAAFRAQLGSEEVDETVRVRGFVWFEKGRAEWIYQAHRIDALTGAYLGVLEPKTQDRLADFVPANDGGQP